MNYMKEVAEALGVEVEERFKIDGIQDEDYHWYISEKGLRDERAEDKIEPSNKLLCKLLLGEVGIIKKPWMPNYNEVYYYVDVYRQKIYSTRWIGYHNDLLNYTMGNVFKTELIADVNKQNVLNRVFK